MKTLLYLFLLIPVLAYSQQEIVTREMVCNDTEIIVKTLRGKYKEIPLLIGQANDDASSVMTLWMNPETRSWTITATKDDFSCVIGMGEQIQPFPQINKQKKYN